MSNTNSTSDRFNVQEDPNQYFAGLVLCPAYNSDTRQNQEVRLYVTPNGALEVHTANAIYPVRAVHLTYLGNARLESDDFEICGDDEQPTLGYKPVYLQIPREAWNAAAEFAKQVAPMPNDLETSFLPTELTIHQIPILWMGFGVEVA